MSIVDILYKKPYKFITEVRQELRKVAWSTRQEVLSSTVVVLVSTFFMTVYIGLVDLSFSKIVSVVFR